MFESVGRNPQAARFLRFCLVGAIGFVADTGLLIGIVHAFGVNPILAKAFSFAIAVLLTFELNRRWAFGTTRDSKLWAALATYLGVQSTGFATNFVVFTGLIYGLPVPFNGILVCSAAAAAAALVVNYVGASRFVFGGKPVLQPK